MLPLLVLYQQFSISLSKHGLRIYDLSVFQALLQALGDRKGINRFGDFSAPLDEALIHVSLVWFVPLFITHELMVLFDAQKHQFAF